MDEIFMGYVRFREGTMEHFQDFQATDAMFGTGELHQDAVQR